MFWRLPIATDDGEFVAWFSERGLVRLDFPNDSARRPPAEASDHPVSIEQRTWVLMATDALRLALTGRNPGTLPPFDWTGHTPFRQQVWRAMLCIPAGQTKTYAQIAREAGQPEATRATGSACGAKLPALDGELVTADPLHCQRGPRNGLTIEASYRARRKNWLPVTPRNRTT